MNIAGRILVIVSSVVCLISMFLRYYDYDEAPTLWESTARWDIAMAVLCAGAIVTAVLSWTMRQSQRWHGLTIAAGAALFGSFGYYLFEYSSDRGSAAGSLVAGLGAVCGLIGAVLLAVGTVAPAVSSASPGRDSLGAGLVQPAAQMQPVAVRSDAVPGPGWYSDPAGTGGRRYWDGRTWTDHVDLGGTT